MAVSPENMNLEAPRLVESSELIKESTNLRSCRFAAPQNLLESLSAESDDRVDLMSHDSRSTFSGSKVPSVTVRESAQPKSDTSLNPKTHKAKEDERFGSNVETKSERMCLTVPTPLSLATKVSILQSFMRSGKEISAVHRQVLIYDRLTNPLRFSRKPITEFMISWNSF